MTDQPFRTLRNKNTFAYVKQYVETIYKRANEQ